MVRVCGGPVCLFALGMNSVKDEEKAGIITEFKCSLFSDLTISIEDIFEGLMEF